MFRLISCGTTPMHDFAASRSVSRSWPKTCTEPADLRISDVMMPIAVVLPAPFGPSSAKKSPSRTVEVYALQRFHAVGVDLAQILDD